MKIFKRIILFFLLLLTTSQYAQQHKTIYITLDVSGSMTSRTNKYEYANYATQVIAVLNQEQDVVLIVGSRAIDLSGKNTYKKIQRNIYSPHTEIADIRKFNKIFDKNKTHQEIFIVGDGHWANGTEIKSRFIENVATGNLRVTFLEILEDVNIAGTDFENFLRENAINKIYQTDNSKNLIESLNTIIEEISGVKSLPNNEYSISGKCLNFKLLLNAKNIMFVYQDALQLNKLPQIASISIDGVKTDIKVLGQPSTESFVRYGGLMSSNIYKLNKPVKAGSEIKVCFTQEIDASKLRIFPMIDASFGDISIVTENTKTKQIDINTVAVCDKSENASIKMGVLQDGSPLTKEALKRTKIYILANGERYEAKYTSGVFEAIVPLKSKETKYTIESIIGYKRINSGQKKIIKTADCEPLIPPLETKELPNQNVGMMNLEHSGCDETFRVKILDEKTQFTLNPEEFDIKVDNNYKYLFKKVDVQLTTNNEILLKLQSRGFWCSCFVPDEVTFNFVAKPKHFIDGKRYKELHVPLVVKIGKGNQGWLDRCGWLFFSLLGSLFLIFFLIKLSKKKRFRKGAKIILKSPSARTLKSRRPKYIDNGYKLRTKGFLAWLNRWLNPFGTENKTTSFVNIGNKSFHFYASRSDNKVVFPKSNFDEKTMTYYNFDEDSKSKYVDLDNSSEIKIKHRNRTKGNIDYFIRYDYPEKGWNDKASFRFFISLIVLILTIYVFASIFLLIISIT